MEFPLYPYDDEESRRAEAVGLTFANLIGECRRVAEEHGFTDATVGEDLALIHSEVSEALEEYRNGHAPDELYYSKLENIPHKPEGVPAELADVVIRIFHFCGKHRIDLASAVLQKMDYNKSRPFKHGGKKL